MNFTDTLTKAAEEFGISLEAAQLQAFDTYYQLVIEWNQKMNLTAITEPEEFAVKHVIDSLSALDMARFPENASLVDVGTGAGFPGIPLKIMRPDLNLVLVDSLNKRVGFLREVASRLAFSDTEAIHGRAEELARDKQYREKFTLATARAVARLNVLCELCIPFVKTGGYFIAMKGAQYQEEILEAKRSLAVLGCDIEEARRVILPGLDDIRAVIYIHKQKQTPSEYPRRAGIPEKKPL